MYISVYVYMYGCIHVHVYICIYMYNYVYIAHSTLIFDSQVEGDVMTETAHVRHTLYASVMSHM